MHISIKESYATELARCIAKAIVDDDSERYEKYMEEARQLMSNMSRSELMNFRSNVKKWSGN